jgi:hypothetical protein
MLELFFVQGRDLIHVEVTARLGPPPALPHP